MSTTTCRPLRRYIGEDDRGASGSHLNSRPYIYIVEISSAIFSRTLEEKEMIAGPPGGAPAALLFMEGIKALMQNDPESALT